MEQEGLNKDLRINDLESQTEQQQQEIENL